MEFLPTSGVDEAIDGLASKRQHVGDFQTREPEDSDRGGVDERVGVAQVALKCLVERGEGDFVEADKKRFGRIGREDFVEDDGEIGVGNGVEAERRLAHLAHASSKRSDMLGTEIGVVREGCFQLIDRLGGDPGVEDLVETLERIMIALQAADARLDAESRPRGVFESRQARERRKTTI